MALREDIQGSVRPCTPERPGLPGRHPSHGRDGKRPANRSLAMSPDYPESSHELVAAEEVEVWWGAYAGRTLLPGFVLCGLVTVGLMGALYVWGDPQHPNPRYVTYLLVAP